MPAEADRGTERLVGIGEAAAKAGVSERALRYYQQLGLINPSGCTPGGLRRYSDDDLARVERLRELQELLGFDLEAIRAIFDTEDRLAALKAEYRSEETDDARRRELIAEGLALRGDLRTTVVARLERLQRFLDHLDAERERLQGLLDGDELPAPQRPASA
ncbi:MAG TPA: MerR family transcriptional regulator [Acidimicrobiales bacterium]|nr:MerR family transcriptional regulator [Acidimicrobiales bacterium]